MIETLIKNWWLLFLRGFLALLFSVTVFLMRSSAESFTLREFAMKGTVVFLGILALIAGGCTAAAGIWMASSGKWWLLLLDGIALSSAGLLLILADRFSFQTVIHAVVVLASAVGLVELGAAVSLRRHISDEWFLVLAGLASLGFAVLFLVRKVEDPQAMFLWL